MTQKACEFEHSSRLHLICFTVERSTGYFKIEIQFLDHECDIRGNLKE